MVPSLISGKYTIIGSLLGIVAAIILGYAIFVGSIPKKSCDIVFSIK
jgi:ABC-type uncharacterized transport system permease subunit